MSEYLERFGFEARACDRVLIVDDEAENLIVIEALLEDDFDVFTAESGAEALEILAMQREAGEPVDLVVSDQRMPGMTGVELLTAVARESPSCVRMVLTAYSDVDPIVTAVNRGSVYRFLLKPWDRDELTQAIRDGLQFKSRQDALENAVSMLIDRQERGQKVLADLRRTQDQFVAAERLSTLGRLTAGITHDIRNQLSALLFMVDLVQSETSSPAAVESAQRAYDTLQSLQILIGDVNAFAQRKHIEVHRSPVETRRFVEETIALFALDKLGSGVKLEVDIPPETASLRVDGNRLRQAVMALLRNAAQAAGPDATIQLRCGLSDGETFLEVVDQGPGMDAATLAVARKPFFSAFDPPGLGMGLGIAELVADAHGGRLTLESSPGRGTRARVWLGRQSESA